MSALHLIRPLLPALHRIGIGVVVAVTALALAAPAGAATTPDPWTQPGFNAANSHDNLAEQLLTPAKVASIKKLATIKTSTVGVNAGPCTSGVARPVESAGYVYTITNNALVKSNARTGATVWAKTLDTDGTTIWSTVSVANGLAIAGGTDCISQSDPNGYLVALSVATGARTWARTPYPYGALDNMSVSGNYVLSAGTSAGSGFNVSVLNLATGAPVWGQNYTTDCGNGGPILVAGGNVLVNTCDYSPGGTAVSTLVAYTLGTGARKWSRAGHWGLGAGDTDASTAKDVYLTNSHGYLTDVTPQTGVIKGVFASSTHAVLAVGNSRLFTTCTAGVCAYARSTRALLWSYRDTSAVSASVGGTVIYLSDGTVLQSETGALLRHLFSGTHVTVVADGYVYVGFAIYGS